jgi:TolB-like protein
MFSKNASCLRFLPALLLAALLCLVGPASAQQVQTVAVVPFAINAEKDMGFLQKGITDMLRSRLAAGSRVTVKGPEEMGDALAKAKKPLDREGAMELGKSVEADFVLFGSVTVFGDAVSLDAAAVAVESGQVTTFARTSETMADVIPGINAFAAQINQELLGRSAPAAAQPAIEPEMHSRAHPYTLIEQDLLAPSPPAAPSAPSVAAPAPGAMAPAAVSSVSPFVVARSQDSGFWSSPEIATGILGLCLMDMEGDGINETALLGENAVFVYRFVKGGFQQVDRVDLPRHFKALWVDAGDINGNGRNELFVSAINTGNQRLASIVYEWSGQRLVPVVEGAGYYFRVHRDARNKAQLFGQTKGVSDLFLSGVYPLEARGNDFVRSGASAVPGAQTAFGFAQGQVVELGSANSLYLDENGAITLYSSEGRRVWRSEKEFGGSTTYLDVPGTETRRYLPQRLIVKPWGTNGRDAVLVVRNTSTTGRMLERFRHYTKGSFVCLGWDGLGLSPLWETREISGYIADYAVGDFTNDGKLDLVAAVVKGGLISSSTTVIAYSLDQILNQ